MVMRFTAASALVLLSASVLSGCPATGAPVVGAWPFYLDHECDMVDIGDWLVALYSDHTAELFDTEVRAGTWSVIGTTIAVTFPDVDGAQLIFTGTLGADVITEGVFTVDDVPAGCWSAQRVVS